MQYAQLEGLFDASYAKLDIIRLVMMAPRVGGSEKPT